MTCRGLFFSCILALGWTTVSHAQNVETAPQIAQKVAAMTNHSGILPLHMGSALLVTHLEGSGSDLIYNVEIKKKALKTDALDPKIKGAAQNVFLKNTCENRASYSLLNKGITVVVNYRKEEAPKVLLSLRISKKECDAYQAENSLHTP
ncbi:hypothetical protein [Saccharibacter floricola]|uniref:Uncharacterized protein n=1 Tax=Saccharibacter floricola DSM 15669 TaxID=1123227 RepID=A0ABQ0P0S1_9PROT|nr:hypothetical protein [Saccharibacter floricola]GBQ08350.1 hypothetical protein AA15669_1747 [Saccharibacter floricola DSM 15669]